MPPNGFHRVCSIILLIRSLFRLAKLAMQPIWPYSYDRSRRGALGAERRVLRQPDEPDPVNTGVGI